MIRRVVLLAVLSLALTLPAGAAVLVVDCVAGPFLTIQAAVNVAVPDDVVAVHPCAAGYPGFVVFGKQRLQVVAAEFTPGLPPLVGAFPTGVGTPPPNAVFIFEPVGSCVYIRQSQDISIVGLTLEFCNQRGFRLLNARNVDLHGNSTFFTGMDGAELRNSSRVQIDGNYFSGPQGNGISIDLTSRFNFVQDNEIFGVLGFAILLDGVQNHVINNQVSNNTLGGIVVRATSSQVSRNTVMGNGGIQIDYTALPAGTCLVGNDTLGGIAPAVGGCRAENT